MANLVHSAPRVCWYSPHHRNDSWTPHEARLSNPPDKSCNLPPPLSPLEPFCLQVPFLIMALVPISCIAVLLGNRYLNASRELKRLDSVSKSPIYAHFSESVNGVSTM